MRSPCRRVRSLGSRLCELDLVVGVESVLWVLGALYFFTSSLRPQVLRIIRFLFIYFIMPYFVLPNPARPQSTRREAGTAAAPLARVDGDTASRAVVEMDALVLSSLRIELSPVLRLQ